MNKTRAPERFAEWLATYRKTDKFGRTYCYHPRSDAHSKQLSMEILEDLISDCSVLRSQGSRGKVGYGINTRHKWPNGKTKALDLAVGRVKVLKKKASPIGGVPQVESFSEVLLSCELKSAMTEHGKSQPRIFDELGSSHEIVHQGRPEAIAAGVAVVNIASTFVSPTRNQSTSDPVTVTSHQQPHVTERMVEHLRGLTIRDKVGEYGFDAYCTIIVECDNQGVAQLWTHPPSPNPGDADHYDTFLQRLVRFYKERFGGA